MPFIFPPSYPSAVLISFSYIEIPSFQRKRVYLYRKLGSALVYTSSHSILTKHILTQKTRHNAGPNVLAPIQKY